MWKKLYNILPEIEYNDWKIQHEIDPYDNISINTCLFKNEIGVMDDSLTEYNLTTHFLDRAFGNVLILGLGLGLVPLYLQDNSNIKKIDIVEIDSDLIKLIKKYIKFNDNINIINEDCYKFIPSYKYDSIWCDITNIYDDDKNSKLENVMKVHLNDNGIIKHWGI